MRFKLLVEAVSNYAILMLDPSGNITSWNAGAERIKGYREQEILGRHFSRFYTEEDRAAGLPAHVLDVLHREVVGHERVHQASEGHADEHELAGDGRT